MLSNNSKYQEIYKSHINAYTILRERFYNNPNFLESNKNLAREYEQEKKSNSRKTGTLYRFFRAIEKLSEYYPKKEYLEITKGEFLEFFDSLEQHRYIRDKGKERELAELLNTRGELTVSEIANEFGITENNSRVIMRRTHKKFKGLELKGKGKNLTIIGKGIKIQHEKTRGYSESTIMGIKTQIKQFYKWLNGGDSVPQSLKFLQIRPIETTINKSQLMTEEEIQKMIDHCDHPRDKAIISIIFEGALRCGELVGIDVGELIRDKYSYIASITVSKTKRRSVRLITSIPYLAAWLQVHPRKDDPTAPLWLAIGPNKTESGRLGTNGVRRLLQRVKEELGIKKRGNPHVYRHSRASSLSQILTDAEMRIALGWTKKSDMPSLYSHLNQDDVDKKILAQHDFIELEKQEKSILSPVKCQICNNLIPPENKFCGTCGTPKSVKVMLEQQVKDEKELDFMNQVTMKYQQLKEQGLSTEEIVKKLNS